MLLSVNEINGNANETFECEYFSVAVAVAARVRCSYLLLLLRDVQSFFQQEKIKIVIHLNHTHRRYVRENAERERERGSERGRDRAGRPQ